VNCQIAGHHDLARIGLGSTLLAAGFFLGQGFAPSTKQRPILRGSWPVARPAALALSIDQLSALAAVDLGTVLGACDCFVHDAIDVDKIGADNTVKFRFFHLGFGLPPHFLVDGECTTLGTFWPMVFPRKIAQRISTAKRIRFENSQQVGLVLQAANNRGLSFNAFVRMAAVATARKVLEAPAEQLLDAFIDPNIARDHKGS
jgi:hypothetical protein